MKANQPEKVDMHHYPFRGIYTEIAREEGISRQAVQQAARKGNPRILDRIAEKVEQRKAILQKYSRSGAGVPPRQMPPDPEKSEV